MQADDGCQPGAAALGGAIDATSLWLAQHTRLWGNLLASVLHQPQATADELVLYWRGSALANTAYASAMMAHGLELREQLGASGNGTTPRRP